ncbi:DUF960 family protein [Clostridium butyricum]|uniref:DUF960 family protein n=1 Tax=Clostridium butyricum TaxID=1492 RepID=UPI00374E9FA3
MFEKENRYMTRGINAEVDIRMQIILWDMIDKLKEQGDIKLDYLQVFEIEKINEIIKIEHRQEVPNYSQSYMLNGMDIEINSKIKIFVLDDGENSTMMLAEEY